MISSIHIEGFRRFEHFEMGSLGRVNLLVGANNSGKTSLLEALHLLTGRAAPRALWQGLWRRGERVVESMRQVDRDYPEVDAAHLFCGHDLQLGSALKLSAVNQTPQRHLTIEVEELTERQRELIHVRGESVPKLGLRLRGSPTPITTVVPLTTSGTFSLDTLEMPRRTRRQRQLDEASRVQYITTDAMNGDDLVRTWNVIALTPEENLVLDALACLDPGIERIAAQAGTRYWGHSPSRSGFIVKHKRFANPVPIGSMGDGIWRIFSLAIAVTQCRGGVLLVDEIDTGLHYSAMSDMWKLIINAAYKFDVQVFATTHSSDCLTSLVSNDAVHNDLTNQSSVPVISVQRIEKDSNHAVPYTKEEIEIATRHHVEMR